MKKLLSVCLALVAFSFCFSQAPSFSVAKSGKGKPVLFFPGFTTPGSVWAETVKNLKVKSENHLFTYAGFSGLAAIDTPWYNTIKEDLIHYIQNEKLSNITLIGHSMGGMIAIDLAAALPDKIDKLVLVDALPSMRDLMLPGVTADKIQYNTPYNNQVLQMKDTAFRQMARMMAEGMTNNKSKTDTLMQWILVADRKTYVYGYTDLLKLDLREDLSKIRAKSLILGATFPTKDIAKATFEKQYANLKGATIEMAPESRHFIMYDQPEWFYKQVNAFLEK